MERNISISIIITHLTAMKITIKQVSNGYVLSYKHDTHYTIDHLIERKEVYDKDGERLAELRCFKRLIEGLQELIGPTYSKYSKYNLGIRCKVKGHRYIEPEGFPGTPNQFGYIEPEHPIPEIVNSSEPATSPNHEVGI